jgi:2-desacetyl-2-hydroxyethyl bacteriochlorophyllide A dehydrogenase
MDKNIMHALCYNRPHKLQLVDLPIPVPQTDEVLIEVAYSGICGTDLHILNEESPAAEKVILGHEFSGRIVATGKSVHILQPGDRVAVDPNNYCGTCEYCLRRQVHFCQNIKPIGVFRDGGWAEYCAVPSALVHPLPTGIDPIWAALAEPISCILHGWDRIQPLHPEQKILILGAGLIGLLWILTLNKFGISNTLVSEPRASRRESARKLKLHCIEPEQILQQNPHGEKGFDVIIDCSGNPAAIEQALNFLNPLGKFLFFGVCPQDSKINIKPFTVFQKEWTFYGSVINPFTFARSLEVISNIQRPLTDMGIITYRLDEYEHALQAAREGYYSKVMFELTKK